MSGYELHQKLRTKVVRLTKKKAYPEAITALHTGALELLSQGEQGSGCDLGIYMLDVYNLADTPVTAETRSRVTDIVAAAKADFWRKKLVDAAVKWSSKSGGADAELRLFAAKLYAKDGEYELAEPHFLAASSSDPEAAKEFAGAMAAWLSAVAKRATEEKGEERTQDAIERIEAGRFALRATLPLLASRNVPAAVAFIQTYLETLTARLRSLLLPISPNPRAFTAPNGTQTDFKLSITANSELNFAQMATALSLAAQSGVNDALRTAWANLVRQFERESQPDPNATGAIAQIGTAVFGIAQRRQGGNMLSDMMASLFNAPPQQQRVAAPPTQSNQPPPSATSAATEAKADDLVDDEMD
ncbi:cytoplasmic protein [Moesziomyces antarcticus]|uniref:Related to GET4 - protein with a role in insertion of tail-anchored proteins into the ER membrane n=1 Tax=Pseudozyma antarctica TaxID=84753 RepID=A0A5C3FI12_PSEA2|nr:cytoplasmic protein [Moesziomyces antarcticus]GAK63371.1 cytoplasmic protein [Moesziomyces antarcticus]SPO43954.1 related to GET4 - protein with a role in insertion of tail-anchored proteins into the ER membrane [Moesziomyces antarcticus]